jgi:hypothetical protein
MGYLEQYGHAGSFFYPTASSSPTTSAPLKTSYQTALLQFESSIVTSPSSPGVARNAVYVSLKTNLESTIILSNGA